jgi:hypothetical protein
VFDNPRKELLMKASMTSLKKIFFTVMKLGSLPEGADTNGPRLVNDGQKKKRRILESVYIFAPQRCEIKGSGLQMGNGWPCEFCSRKQICCTEYCQEAEDILGGLFHCEDKGDLAWEKKKSEKSHQILEYYAKNEKESETSEDVLIEFKEERAPAEMPDEEPLSPEEQLQRAIEHLSLRYLISPRKNQCKELTWDKQILCCQITCSEIATLTKTSPQNISQKRILRLQKLDALILENIEAELKEQERALNRLRDKVLDCVSEEARAELMVLESALAYLSQKKEAVKRRSTKTIIQLRFRVLRLATIDREIEALAGKSAVLKRAMRKSGQKTHLAMSIRSSTISVRQGN